VTHWETVNPFDIRDLPASSLRKPMAQTGRADPAYGNVGVLCLRIEITNDRLRWSRRLYMGNHEDFVHSARAEVSLVFNHS